MSRQNYRKPKPLAAAGLQHAVALASHRKGTQWRRSVRSIDAAWAPRCGGVGSRQDILAEIHGKRVARGRAEVDRRKGVRGRGWQEWLLAWRPDHTPCGHRPPTDRPPAKSFSFNASHRTTDRTHTHTRCIAPSCFSHCTSRAPTRSVMHGRLIPLD